MEAPTRFPGPSARRMALPVVGPIANVDEARMLEKIVLHSFAPVPGEEGEMAASPHGKKALAAVSDLKRIYGMDYDMHRYRRFQDVAVETSGHSLLEDSSS